MVKPVGELIGAIRICLTPDFERRRWLPHHPVAIATVCNLLQRVLGVELEQLQLQIARRAQFRGPVVLAEAAQLHQKIAFGVGEVVGAGEIGVHLALVVVELQAGRQQTIAGTAHARANRMHLHAGNRQPEVFGGVAHIPVGAPHAALVVEQGTFEAGQVAQPIELRRDVAFVQAHLQVRRAQLPERALRRAFARPVSDFEPLDLQAHRFAGFNLDALERAFQPRLLEDLRHIFGLERFLRRMELAHLVHHLLMLRRGQVRQIFKIGVDGAAQVFHFHLIRCDVQAFALQRARGRAHHPLFGSHADSVLINLNLGLVPLHPDFAGELRFVCLRKVAESRETLLNALVCAHQLEPGQVESILLAFDFGAVLCDLSLVELERAVGREFEDGLQLFAHQSAFALPVAFRGVAEVFEPFEARLCLTPFIAQLERVALERVGVLFYRAPVILNTQDTLLEGRAAQFQPQRIVVAFQAFFLLPALEQVCVQSGLGAQHLLRGEAFADILIVALKLQGARVQVETLNNELRRFGCAGGSLGRGIAERGHRERLERRACAHEIVALKRAAPELQAIAQAVGAYLIADPFAAGLRDARRIERLQAAALPKR